jgi:hypothetical protein
MNGEGSSSLATLSDSQKLYQLGLAQEINSSVCVIFRTSFSIVIIAFFFRCLASYGAASEHSGLFAGHV